ncbi:hypothetical protein EJB05_37495 [Eragrostis curvula]|uniref:Uncharacterized protein n=1 Tax=Eragrostis curvula TaxID=38414 RepID=A0A5J9TRS0_9POAL|nr:hypothetical protein EJB05_37495 [Eragrostis curvula]
MYRPSGAPAAPTSSGTACCSCSGTPSRTPATARRSRRTALTALLARPTESVQLGASTTAYFCQISSQRFLAATSLLRRTGFGMIKTTMVPTSLPA